ncbi:MAG: hypothetical protein WCF67_02935 [Chitinophagaceae bacterium]
MDRRNFVQQAAAISLGLGLGFPAIKKWYSNNPQFAQVSGPLANDFDDLVKWLRSNGWASYLQKTLDVNLFLKGEDLQKELVKELDENKLMALRQAENSGYDDFAGNRLLQPGFPAYSLLYHTIASPRVRPADAKEFPSLKNIDTLENYIYGLCNWDELKSLYKIDSADQLVFAVFAYEYRPAFKTPHQTHADLVYSRTGIARIGSEPHNYDKLNRCHTAKPANASREKTAAVMPARYGLFIARIVKNENISLVKSIAHKGEDSKDDRNDSTKLFLQPIRKVFDNDTLVNNASIRFAETHKTEKLKKFADMKSVVMWQNRKPRVKDSKTLIVQDDKWRKAGSSFLVISQPTPLIRAAKEDNHVLFFKVPERKTDPYDTRFFTALCTREVEDVELLEGNQLLSRTYNDYLKPRNQPLFINITNRKIDNKETFRAVPQTRGKSFEITIDAGKYYAPLFEDSICDGMVYIANTTLLLENKSIKLLPAFSIVTAPDFFPQVDPLDMVAYDIAPGSNNNSNFYEGGVASLATARIKPNPKIINTKNESTKDTYLAVLSHLGKEKTGVAAQRLMTYKDPAAERGYDISGFLPDVASSVFAPGWDVTYCSLDDITDIYVGTEGLGAPFIEDMKFCAALNGMWPATSPDSARTFQGSNEAEYRNPTAVPLLDVELGISAKSSAGKAHENWGWDGEQGPYLEKDKGADYWKINFTDLGRADAVNNALQGKVDLSQLRKLKSSQLIDRMECLKRCIETLPSRNFRDTFKPNVTAFTYLWLVSAEEVNWGNEEARALGVPDNLAGTNKTWITDKANAKVTGPGYLYVFANSDPDGEDKDWSTDLKRRRLRCTDIYVCQVTNNPASAAKIAWTKITGDSAIKWEVI